MKLAPTPIADSYFSEDRKNESQDVYPLDLFLCEDCGLVHLPDVVDPEIIYRNYLYETTTSPGLVEHFQKYADNIINQLNPEEGAFLIELGSNDGTLLKCFQNRGMKVLGVDPARDIAQRATEAGMETIPEFFNNELAKTIVAQRGKAKIIIANNVMANIDDLIGWISGIRDVMAPDGVFIFESGYLVDTVQNRVFDNIYHEHISYLSVKPLEAFFKKYGMELIRVDRTPTKGGSIRGTVQLAGGARAVESSVQELMDMETNLGVYSVDWYKTFAAKIDAEKEKLVALLKDLKARGKTVAGFGASHSVTTFLHYFGLGDLLDFMVDDNPRKHNTFSPGHHIPVFPAREIYEREPDYVVILAWRFYAPIIKNHQAYLDQGGHFIIPLPEMQVRENI